VGRIHEIDGLNAANITAGARIFAMSATRYLLVAINNSSLIVKVFELSENGLTKSAEQTTSVGSSARLFSVAVISENFAKMFYVTTSGSSTIQYAIEVECTDGVVSVGTAQGSGSISTAVNGITPSNNARAALLNSPSAI